MDRNLPARFSKKGPRAERVLRREAMAIVEKQVEQYVREKMRPELTQAARQATMGFKRERGR